MSLISSKQLVNYIISSENGKQIVTYSTEGPLNETIELGKIELDNNFTPDTMTLLQLFVTPHVHNSLLEAIVPFVEQVLLQVKGQTEVSLRSWLTQAKSLLNSPK